MNHEPRPSSKVYRFVVPVILGIHPASAMDWVPVGDPGNQADPYGNGAVSNHYKIGRCEVTNSEYGEFLNSVDPQGLNAIGLFNAAMASDPRGGIVLDPNSAVGAKFSVRPNMEHKPVNFVSWFDAARFANWMHHGRNPEITETGAYALNGATSGTGFPRNPEARVWIPTDAEWHKAAYYKGGSTNAGYWTYPTQANNAPQQSNANSSGVGNAGPSGNFANFGSGARWNGAIGHVTTVGTNGGASPYGTHDQGGNVWEWTESNVGGSSKKLKGGCWETIATSMSITNSDYASPATENARCGFRLAARQIGIQSQPQDVTAKQWTTARVSVVVTEPDVTGYQWQKDGVDLTGQTKSELVLFSVQLHDAGSYRVIVRSSTGDVISSPATLSIIPDSDADGLTDSEEASLGTDVRLADSDGDGLSDFKESRQLSTDPLHRDTDRDGFEDGFELATGFDPRLAASVPDAGSSISHAVAFRFNAAIATSYRIEESSDLATWTVLESPIQGEGKEVVRFYLSSDRAKRFFRVRKND